MSIASYSYRTRRVHCSVDQWIFLLQSARIVCVMTAPQQSLKNKIQKIKQQIAALGDLRPGALSQQYNICGNPSCRCKATPPVKHGPYYQISFTWKGKSTTQFVRHDDVPEAQQQLENYRRLRELVEEWITLSVELSRLRIRERRQRSARQKTGPKKSVSKQKLA